MSRIRGKDVGYYQGHFGLFGSGSGMFSRTQGHLGLFGSGKGMFRRTQGHFGLLGSGKGMFSPALIVAALAPTDNASIADTVKMPW